MQRPLGRDLLGLFGNHVEAHIVGTWLMEQQGVHPFFQLPSGSPPQLLAMTLSTRPNTLPTFSPRPYVLNFLLFAILNLLSSFMPLDPPIKEQTTQESLRPSGLMHGEPWQGLPWQARSPRSCPQACN